MEQTRKTEIAKEAAKILLDTKSVLFNAREPFTYTSGRKGPVYIDCRRLIAFPEEREILMQGAVEIFINDIGLENIDYFAGGETAGIPYAGFIAQITQKPMLFVRKKPKGHGRMAQIEGHFDPEKNPKVMLIEDLQTDGGSKAVFVDALREAGATVEHAFVVFHYGIFDRSKENMDRLGLKLHELTNWWHVLEVAKEQNYFDAETLAAVEEFLNDPENWGSRHESVSQ